MNLHHVERMQACIHCSMFAVSMACMADVPAIPLSMHERIQKRRLLLGVVEI